MIVAEITQDYIDIQKLITIPKGSIFKLDDKIYVSPRGLHISTIILEGRIAVIPRGYYILKSSEE